MVTKTAVQGNGLTAKLGAVEHVTIAPPNFQELHLTIRGTAPYVQERFSNKAIDAIMDKQKAGSTAKKGTQRKARDFEQDYQDAQHISEEGWHGIPAPNFRNAAIDACRAAGFVMTRAKMSIFILSDGIDRADGSPLVRINGEPQIHIAPTRNATGVCDLRARPMWRSWSALVRILYDGDQFTATDVINLLARAGTQVGIGAGRPFSKNSNGLGWGTFEIVTDSVADRP